VITTRPPRATAVVVTALSIGSALLAGCVHPGPPGPPGPAGEPVWAPIPRAAPATEVVGGACRVVGGVYEGPGHASDPLVGVDTFPVGAVAVWLPMSSQQPCEAVITEVDLEPARRLAAMVTRAPGYDPANVGCAGVVGANVQLTFTHASTAIYPNQDPHAGEGTQVTLTYGGCQSIVAPGRAPRALDPAIRREMARLAPPGWLPYLPGS
jgi:hypothetical protein